MPLLCLYAEWPCLAGDGARIFEMGGGGLGSVGPAPHPGPEL